MWLNCRHDQVWVTHLERDRQAIVRRDSGLPVTDIDPIDFHLDRDRQGIAHRDSGLPVIVLRVIVRPAPCTCPITASATGAGIPIGVGVGAGIQIIGGGGPQLALLQHGWSMV
jgi:hypothetical protein